MPFQVVYTSSATRQLHTEDLAQILREARERNHRLDVTGMLLYNEGTFLQVLEGDEETVTALYERIKGDERHHRVVTLMNQPAKKRAFGKWMMGFRNLDNLPTEDLPEGYLHLMKGPPSDDKAGGPQHAYETLLHFRNVI